MNFSPLGTAPVSARLARRLVYAALLLLPALTAHASGISQKEAARRRQHITEPSYTLTLDFTGDPAHFSGTVEVAFGLQPSAEPLFLDFEAGTVTALTCDDQRRTDYRFDPDKGRLYLPPGLAAGRRILRVAFTAPYDHGGIGMHRFEDTDGATYLYTDLEPDACRRVFPCFDQPDLRAPLQLTLRVPQAWEVSANAPMVSRRRTEGGDEVRFAPTPPLATYLFHVTAGDYAVFQHQGGLVPMRLLVRQDLAPYTDAAEVFRTTDEGLRFFTRYFGRPYPFAKYDQAFVPQYNFGAMENPGAVTINEAFVLGYAPMAADLLARRKVLLHEAAHMWFGNLVTLGWWDELWLNESFASYLEVVALREMGRKDVWRDTLREKASAFAADRRDTAQPILRPVPTSGDARAAFDAITYQKGMNVLEQLEVKLGPEAFREGIRLYLDRHAWKNTDHHAFFDAMSAASGVPLKKWARTRLRSSGHHTVALTFKPRKGLIERAVLHQKFTGGHKAPRDHRIALGLFDRVDAQVVLTDTVTVTLTDDAVDVPALNGRPVPLFILPNVDTHAFVGVELDDQSEAGARAQFHRLRDPGRRYQLLLVFQQMTMGGSMSLQEWFGHLLGSLSPTEPSPFADEIVYWLLEALDLAEPGTASDRRNDRLFEFCLAALDEPDTDPEITGLLFFAMRATARTSAHYAVLDDLFWSRRALRRYAVEDFDRIYLAAHLHAAGYPDAAAMVARLREVLEPRLVRKLEKALAETDPTPEGRARMWAVVMDAARPLDERRDAMLHFFDRAYREASAPYVATYFERLPALAEQESFGFMEAYLDALFPLHAGRDALTAAKALQHDPRLDPLLRRKLRERIADLEERLLRLKNSPE